MQLPVFGLYDGTGVNGRKRMIFFCRFPEKQRKNIYDFLCSSHLHHRMFGWTGGKSKLDWHHGPRVWSVTEAMNGQKIRLLVEPDHGRRQWL